MTLHWSAEGKKKRQIKIQSRHYLYGVTRNVAATLMGLLQRHFLALLRISLLATVLSYLIYLSFLRGWTGHEQSPRANMTVTVYVLLYKRLEGARALLQDLSCGDYNGHKLPLHVMVDRDPNLSAENQEVVKIVRKFRWKHGPLSIHISSKRRGLAQTWLSLGTTCSEGSLLAVFEDDVRLSPYWFNWTMNIYDKYLSPIQRSQSDIADSIIGISLSPIRVKEMRYPYEPWDSTRKVNLSDSVFLHNLPSSWAPVFVCKEWRNFLPYAWYRRSAVFLPDENADPISGAFLGDPNFNLPGCFSNTWNQSWKRLLIEYCFVLGKTTIYPNILGQAGLASNLHLSGTHVSNKKKTRTKLDYRTNHLILDDSIFSIGFPPVDNMAVFDVHSDKASHAILRQQGSLLGQGLLRLGAIYSKSIELIYSSSLALPDFAKKDWYFVCPEGTIYKQLARQVLLLHNIRGEGEGLLLSHLKVFVPGYGYQYIPFSEIFDVPHKIGFTHVKIATMANLVHSKPYWLFSDPGNSSGHACRSYSHIWSDSRDSTKLVSIKSIRQVERQANASRWVGLAPMLVDTSQTALSATQKSIQLLNPNFRTELYMKEVAQKRKLKNSESRLCIEIDHCNDGVAACQNRVHGLLPGVIDQNFTEAIVITDKASSVKLNEYVMNMLHDAYILSSVHIQEHLLKRAPLQSPGLLHATSLFLQFSFCTSSRVLILREYGDLWHLIVTTGFDISQHTIEFW